MKVLLDTDHISIMWRRGSGAELLRSRLAALPDEDVCVCIVSFQEQVRGWLAYLNRARKREQTLQGYRELSGLFDRYRQRPILPFDDRAMDEFESSQRQRIRIGTQDLRIASIAKANGMMLLSRNVRDFRHVPGVEVEDWTI